MRKLTICLLCAIALVSGTAHAATVEEILAAQPAQNTADQAKWSAALIALGKDAIIDLCTRLKPAGGGDDLAVRYALSGIAKHATRPGAEADRALVADAFADALEKVSGEEVRAFLFEQLQLTGNEAVVERIAAYSNRYGEVAAATAALEAIGTPSARAAVNGTRESEAIPAPLPCGVDHRMTPEYIEEVAKIKQMSGRELQNYILSTDQYDFRATALNELSQADDQRTLSVCIDLMEDDDAEIRQSAMNIAERIDDDSASRKLLRAMKKVEDSVAHEVWRSVVRRGDTEVPPAPSGTDADGFTPLFNGVDLDGWDGNRIGYEAQNGVLSWREGGKNIYTDEDYANFHLRFEFKLSPGSNNGLGVRVPLGGHAAYDGMELQILDDDDIQYADIKDYQHHGSVYGVVPAKPGFLRPDGEWNVQEVIADGYHITVILNGATILDANIEEASMNGTLDEKEHSGLLNKTGRLAILGHNTPVAFRNIYIKRL